MSEKVVNFSEKRLEKRLQEQKDKNQEIFEEMASSLYGQTAQGYLNTLIEPILDGKGEVVEVAIPIIATVNDKKYSAIAYGSFSIPDNSVILIQELEPDSKN